MFWLGWKAAQLRRGKVMGKHYETSANYERVLIKGGRYRIAVCRDRLQWLFQQRVTRETCAAERWRTLGYCTSRTALLRLQHRFQGVSVAKICALPETFKSEGAE